MTQAATYIPHWQRWRVEQLEAVLQEVEGDLQEETEYTLAMDGGQFANHLERMRKWYRPLKQKRTKQ